jgi:hypothetical protein
MQLILPFNLIRFHSNSATPCKLIVTPWLKY